MRNLDDKRWRIVTTLNCKATVGTDLQLACYQYNGNVSYANQRLAPLVEGARPLLHCVERDINPVLDVSACLYRWEEGVPDPEFEAQAYALVKQHTRFGDTIERRRIYWASQFAPKFLRQPGLGREDVHASRTRTKRERQGKLAHELKVLQTFMHLERERPEDARNWAPEGLLEIPPGQPRPDAIVFDDLEAGLDVASPLLVIEIAMHTYTANKLRSHFLKMTSAEYPGVPYEVY